MSSDDAKVHKFLNFKTSEEKYKFWKLMLHSYFESDKSKEREEEIKFTTIKRLRTKDNNYLEEKSWQSQSIESIHRPNEFFDDDSFFHEQDNALVIPSNRQINHHINFSSEFDSSSNSEEEQKSQQFPQTIKIKPIQLKIWRILFNQKPNEIYNLWFKHFDVFQKVCLWNNLQFPGEYLKSQTEVKTKYDEILNFCTNAINYKMRKSISDIKKIDSHKKMFKYLYTECKQIDDVKMMLWIPLDVDEKLRMLLAEKDNQQAEIMIAFLILEYELCGLDLKQIETRL